MNAILIFGAGNTGREITRYIDKTKNKILFFVDNNVAKQDKYLLGRKIIGPEKIADLEYDYILIASNYWKDIRKQLYSLGVDEKKIRLPLAKMKVKRFYEEYKEIYNIFGKFLYVYKKWYLKQQMLPDWGGVFVNPYFLSRKSLYEAIVQYSHYLTGKCMDFGCGMQPYKRLLSVDEYVGVEIATDDKRKGIVYYDGHTLPFDNEEFDSIISSEVFEHVSNIEEIIIELKRVLKGGGIMLVTVPFAYPKHCWPFDYRRYTSQGIKQLMENAGFKCIECRPCSNYWECIAQLKNVYLEEEIRTETAFGRFLKSMVRVINNLNGVTGSKIMPKSEKLYLDNIIIVQK